MKVSNVSLIITDSLDVKKVFWMKSMKVPGTPWTIRGYSRSAYRTGFYIKDLDIMLDAGPQNYNNPKHIFEFVFIKVNFN